MKAVGVKSLKARLSEHLRFVKAGETILVTERDEVIAESRPAYGRFRAEGPLSAVLATLAESGEVVAPTQSKAGWRWEVRGLGLPAGTAADIMNHVREDRD